MVFSSPIFLLNMSVTKNVEVLCRICSEENKGTNIYGEEGIRNKLEAKIRSYLHIEVSVKLLYSRCYVIVFTYIILLINL